MLQLETTPGCGQTPRVLMASEELGIPIELVFREEGHFIATHRRPGPILHDGELRLFSGNAIGRHLCRTHGGGRLLPPSLPQLAQVDEWLDFSFTGIGIPIVRMMQELAVPLERRDPQRLAQVKKMVDDGFAVLDRAIAGLDWLVGDFTLADCSMATMGRARGKFDMPPNVERYVDRLVSRPSYARMQGKLPR